MQDVRKQHQKQTKKDTKLSSQNGVDNVGPLKSLSGGTILDQEKAKWDVQPSHQKKEKKKRDRALAVAGQDDSSGQRSLQKDVATPQLETAAVDLQSLQEVTTKKKRKKDTGLQLLEGGLGQQSPGKDVASPSVETPLEDTKSQPGSKKKKKKDRGLLLEGQCEERSGQFTSSKDVGPSGVGIAAQEEEKQSRKENKKKSMGHSSAGHLEDGLDEHIRPAAFVTPELEILEQDEQQTKKKKRKKDRELVLASQGDNSFGQLTHLEGVAPSIKPGVQEGKKQPQKKKRKKDRGHSLAGQGEGGSGHHKLPEDATTLGLEITDQDVQKQPHKKKKKRRDVAGQLEDGLGQQAQEPGDGTPEVETDARDALRKKNKKRKEKFLALEGHTEASLETGDVAAHKGEEAVQRSKKKKRKTILETEQADEGAVPEDVKPSPDKVQPEGKKRQKSSGVVLLGDRAESWKADTARTDLKYGAFSKEEDERLRAAVAEYIQEHNLGDNGVEKLLNTSKYKEIKGAWLEIGRCLPDRSVRRVHARATRLLHDGNYKGKWSLEEEAMLRSLYAQMGSKWAQLGRAIGRLPEACKEKWRILRVVDKRAGRWSPEESQELARLVQESLAEKQMRSSVERVIDGRQVVDDINWTPISERMGDRTANQCLLHWYRVLAPRTVRTTGVDVESWGREDDRTMLLRILESGATSEVDVEWGSLLPDRDGATCRKRWRMMVKHLPPGENFEANVLTLCERYAPDLILESRLRG